MRKLMILLLVLAGCAGSNQDEAMDDALRALVQSRAVPPGPSEDLVQIRKDMERATLRVQAGELLTSEGQQMMSEVQSRLRVHCAANPTEGNCPEVIAAQRDSQVAKIVVGVHPTVVVQRDCQVVEVVRFNAPRPDYEAVPTPTGGGAFNVALKVRGVMQQSMSFIPGWHGCIELKEGVPPREISCPQPPRSGCR